MILAGTRHWIQILCLSIFICYTVSSCSEPKYQLTPLGQDALILAFGDSLTFGTGSNPDTESYPAILQNMTGRKVINAGVPGEISERGLTRLKIILQTLSPDLVILCHGANDLLRRLDKTKTAANLAQMIEVIQQSGTEVVLVAVPELNLMLTIPDFYRQLADRYSIPAELSIIAELERAPELKSDSIHPNATGYRLLTERIVSLLQSHGAV